MADERPAARGVQITIPAPGSQLLLNLLGVLGLVAIVVAVGGLAGWLWGLLAAGGFMVGLCVVGWTHELANNQADEVGKPVAPAVAAVAAVTRSA